MKRKVLPLIAIFGLATGVAQAQNLQVKAGVNLANISTSENGTTQDRHMLTSFHAGLVTDLPLGSKALSFQPGVLFTGKGAKVQNGDEASAQYSKVSVNPYYLEIPANFVLRLPMGNDGGFFVGAGPYGAVGIAGKYKLEGKLAGVEFNDEADIKWSKDDPTTTGTEEGAGYGVMRRFDYGLNGIAGIETKNIVLSANYGYGLAKLQSGSNSSNNDKNKHRVVSFSVGIKL